MAGQDKAYSFIPPHQGGSLDFAFHKKKSLVRKTKGAHLWALCGGWAIRPFQHRGSAPFVTRPAVGTYGTLNVSSLPSPPPEIIWQYPFDQRSAAASPMEVKCIKWYRRQNLYDIPCSTALQLCVNYSLRDRCIVFIQEVSVSPSMTYEIIDKSDKNFNTFPQVGVVWLWHVRHLSMTIRTFIHLRIIDSSKSAWYKSLNLYQSILSDRY